MGWDTSMHDKGQCTTHHAEYRFARLVMTAMAHALPVACTLLTSDPIRFELLQLDQIRLDQIRSDYKKCATCAIRACAWPTSLRLPSEQRAASAALCKALHFLQDASIRSTGWPMPMFEGSSPCSLLALLMQGWSRCRHLPS